MQCERSQELFSDYIEDTLTPAMRQVMSQHVDTCATCKADVEQLRAVYGLLDSGLPMVEVPAGFRANVLNAIREQPVNESFMSRVRAWLAPTSARGVNRAPATAVALGAVLVAVAGGSWMASHTTQPGTNIDGTKMGEIAPWGSIAVPVQDEGGILQGVKNYLAPADGKTYHVFGLHLPFGQRAVAAQAYVIQSADAFSDDSKLTNPDSATQAWSGTVEPGMSVQVPVAVVSDVPAGTSMTLMVKWNDQSGEHKEVCVLPISKPSAQPMVVSAGEPLYQALQTVSVAYDTPLILDESAAAGLNAPIKESLDNTDTDINDSLADIVVPANMSFGQQKDGSYLIDGS